VLNHLPELGTNMYAGIKLIAVIVAIRKFEKNNTRRANTSLEIVLLKKLEMCRNKLCLLPRKNANGQIRKAIANLLNSQHS
jgi:hypothetical protein